MLRIFIITQTLQAVNPSFVSEFWAGIRKIIHILLSELPAFALIVYLGIIIASEPLVYSRLRSNKPDARIQENRLPSWWHVLPT